MFGGRIVVAAALAVGGCSAPVAPLPELEAELSGNAAVDFGPVVVGSSVSRRTSLINSGQASLQFLEPQGTPFLETTNYRFVVNAPEERLAPGAEVEVEIIFEALAGSGPVQVELRLPTLNGPAARIQLRAQISATGLLVQPNPVVFADVPLGQTASQPVTITNLRSTETPVLGLNVLSGRIQYDTLLTRGAFGPLPEVDSMNVWTTLGAGGSTTTMLTYEAPLSPGDGKEQATWRVAECPDEECAVEILVQGVFDDIAQIEVTPTALNFGRISVGVEVERIVRVTNTGEGPLRVESAELRNASPDFRVDGDVGVLEPGERLDFVARYLPEDEGQDRAELVFVSDDPVFPEIGVVLRGTGIELAPCQFAFEPAAIDFGRVPVGQEVREPVRITNVGDDPCLFFESRIQTLAGTLPGVFRIEGEPILSQLLQRFESFTYEIIFTPRPGPARAEFRVNVSNADQPEIVVPLRGEGGEGLALVCSQDQDARVGESVQVFAIANSDVDVLEQSWSITSAPPGGIGTPGQWDPDPPLRDVVRFLPRIVGEYELEHRALDANGQEATCQVSVVAEGRGFQATLTWDGTGDLDLHVHNNAGTPWFTDDDCFFDNRSPLWDPSASPGLGGNPRLDIDDTTDFGPENVFVREPQIGDTYTVAVDTFRQARGRIARVQIFCGASTLPQVDLFSRALRGRANGRCSGNDFWKVATVTFDDPSSCSVEVLDTYVGSDDACQSF